MDRQRIIIDTDPGQDDAVAILLALASQEITVEGIVAVAGNVPLDLTLKNALKICELANKNRTGVYAGASRPLVHNLVTAEHVHGATGLDGPDLPEPQMAVQPTDGIQFIINTLRTNEEKSITLCALGPLTNIALALIQAPDIAPRVKRIVAMGGGFFEGGNITPAAEFNIYVDPHAADIVFRSGIEIVLMPLDVTHKALTNKAYLEAFNGLGTRVGTATAELLDFFERFDIQKYGTEGGPLHDPNVIAWLIAPELYKGRECYVEIETGSQLTRGMTVIDWWGVTGKTPNALVMNEVDRDGFFSLLLERLALL